ncbi:MAG: rRNA maturation RNase YbeY [Proteobacteria bacterium]|nr:rRNA maturation RNase YbeY [Pseudomonadota bacterium]MDA1021813.1 rRNA maturation RNase YbeY [Pseudomonadota bacterium]
MMLEVDVTVRCPFWTDNLKAADALCQTAARASYPASDPAEVSIVLADDAFVRNLNREYRGQDKATNVLSFAADSANESPVSSGALGAPRLLGDVIVAFETVSAEAAAQGKTLADHLCHLVVHGMLHLLGYDHEQDPAAEKMEALEVKILATLEIADPYEGS